MTAAQRRITLGVCLIVGMSLLMAAGLTFLITPMAEELGLPNSLVEDVLAIPSVAALVVVFSAGHLGDRLGQRRTLSIASVAFIVGAVLVALANTAIPLEVGLAICAVAAVTMQIVGVSLLQESTGDGSAQVSAFTWFGVVFPLAFLVIPVATARVLVVTHWRIIPLIWILAGIAMLVVTKLLLGERERSSVPGEWVTPLLAGVAFAAGARAIAEIDDLELDPPLIAVSIAVCLLSTVTYFVVRRRIAEPTFSADPVRGQPLPLLLLAVALVSACGLLTYVSIAVQFLYDLTPYEAALLVIPAQVGAILGARFMAKFALLRWGGLRGARILMITLAFTMLPLVLLQVDTPAWFLVAIAVVFSFMWMAVLTVLNAEIMRRAPGEYTGAVSSFRTAASSLGAAIGVGILGTIVLSSVPIEGGLEAVTGEEIAGLTNSLRVDGVIAFVIAITGWIVLALAQRRAVVTADVT